jgi:site-specific DNA recombinase
VKDPATGKRMGLLNDEREWVIEEVPELRIIENELWHLVKERQKAVREKVLTKVSGIRAERARRPAEVDPVCATARAAS